MCSYDWGLCVTYAKLPIWQANKTFSEKIAEDIINTQHPSLGSTSCYRSYRRSKSRYTKLNWTLSKVNTSKHFSSSVSIDLLALFVVVKWKNRERRENNAFRFIWSNIWPFKVWKTWNNNHINCWTGFMWWFYIGQRFKCYAHLLLAIDIFAIGWFRNK